MNNDINKNNTNTIAYKNIVRNFNIIIGISFIMIISVIYIISIFSINIPSLNSNIDLASLENIIGESFVFYIKILFSFLIPLSIFIFIFLFVLNPVSLKSILISFVLIFLTAFYLYKLDYNILVYPLDNLNAFIKLIVHIVSANFIMLFIAGMSYIRYDIKKLYILSGFYTMIAEIIIWTFLIFFIISLIFISIFAFFYFNGKIELKRLIIFFIRNDMKNLKIILSIFVVLKTCIIYFSYVIYSIMLNTKLSINVSRVLALFISAASILIMKYYRYSNFLLLICIIFLSLFLLNMFLFRIDKDHNKVCFIIYIASNIIGTIFGLFCLKRTIEIFSDIFLIIFNVMIIINFIYNIVLASINRYRKFLFLYNYFYIIFLIILLFY